MAQIKLTPEDLRQSAQRYAQGSQDIDQILTTLTHEQQVIDANWDGSAFDSFEAQFNELSPKIKQFAQLLEDINGQLTKISLHKSTKIVLEVILLLVGRSPFCLLIYRK